MAIGDYYCNRNDINDVYGKNNVDTWAEPNNEGEEEIRLRRINWAIKQAYTYINGRLVHGRYTVPFAPPVPQTIVLISSTYAGILLYNSRRVNSSDKPTDRLAIQNKQVEHWLNQIMGGRLRLTDDCGVELEVTNVYPIGSGEST